jgi:hypothetical protein
MSPSTKLAPEKRRKNFDYLEQRLGDSCQVRFLSAQGRIQARSRRCEIRIGLPQTGGTIGSHRFECGLIVVCFFLDL